MTTEPALAEGEKGVGFRMQVRSSRAAMVVEGLENYEGAGVSWVVSEAGIGVVRGVLRGEEARARVAELGMRDGRKVWWTQGGHLGNEEDAMALRIKKEIDPTGVFGRLSE
jgi:hypothetical protein